MFYIGLQKRVWCGAICLIALFAALSNQERSANKQLAAPLPQTQSQTALFTRCLKLHVHRGAQAGDGQNQSVDAGRFAFGLKKDYSANLALRLD
jgi:hypothetical protein